jgi:hypothetical protein
MSGFVGVSSLCSALERVKLDTPNFPRRRLRNKCCHHTRFSLPKPPKNVNSQLTSCTLVPKTMKNQIPRSASVHATPIFATRVSVLPNLIQSMHPISGRHSKVCNRGNRLSEARRGTRYTPSRFERPPRAPLQR